MFLKIELYRDNGELLYQSYADPRSGLLYLSELGIVDEDEIYTIETIEVKCKTRDITRRDSHVNDK
jgi:hypothetical protein